jgi:hypothetical protein
LRQALCRDIRLQAWPVRDLGILLRERWVWGKRRVADGRMDAGKQGGKRTRRPGRVSDLRLRDVKTTMLEPAFPLRRTRWREATFARVEVVDASDLAVVMREVYTREAFA